MTTIDSHSPDTEVRHYQLYIGGTWVDSKSGQSFDSVNPFGGAVWATAQQADSADVDAAVAAARAALDGPWGQMSATERGRVVRRIGTLVADNAEHLAAVESKDNGKLLREMRSQLNSIPSWFEYYAGLADKLEGRTPPTANTDMVVYTKHEPVGVVAAILPWNSPLLLLAIKLAPALAAGCTVVAKPAEQTPASALEFARLIETAGLPTGVFNVVTGDAETGKALAAHPDVDKVSFTGSTSGGINVLKTAADQLTRVTLELGGKSPNIVFDDADLESAANGVIAGIFAATGQTCVAGSRLLVHEKVRDDLLDRVAERARTIKMGDPAAPDTEMGPAAFREQLDVVSSYVDIARAEGATVLVGGRRPSDPELAQGYFYEPTILTGVRPEMRIAQEEVFGPVLSVITFADEDEAIQIANNSKFGLVAGVWTENVRRAHRVANRLKVGSVWVNTYRVLTYNVPFGGRKFSGLGRENGIEGLLEFTETKAVWINLSEQTRDPFILG